MPIWGIAASPVVEGDLLIVHIGGRPDSCIVAFDKATGEEKWRALKDTAAYSAPIVIDPTQGQLDQRGGVCWSHPAFAYKHIYARNDEELVCADLSATD